MESIKSSDNLYPNHDNCYTCHDEAESECGMCHKDADNPLALPRIESFIAQFSHKQHIEGGAECLSCHAGVENKEDAGEAVHIPDMVKCMTCHTTPSESAGCYVCHQKGESLKPADHGIAWAESHGMYSETGNQNCNSCHRQSYCIECHQGTNLFNESHPAEFIATHSISYLSREINCYRCHENRDYCIECHINVNYVIPANHTIAGWNGSMHAEEARMDYERCTVCHMSGDAVCSTCHTL
jgi:hypothetical protein